uniref:UDP-glucuronosyltransferase n=1 Tax=Culicoides sonorensis TaxID=179676 RepID=A0A336LDL5_CULSO
MKLNTNYPLILVIYIVISISTNSIKAARILALFPTPSYSHQLVFRAVTQALVEKGHELVVLTPNPIANNESAKNLKQIDVSFAYQGYFHKINYAASKEDNIPITSLLNMFTVALEEIMTTEIAHPEMQKILKDPSQKFDAVISEFIGYTPMYAFAKHFKCPLIGITSTEPTYHEHRAIGNYIHSVVHPMNVFPNYKDLGFIERFFSVTLDIVMRLYFEPLVYSLFDGVIDKNFGDTVPRSRELARDVDLLLLNGHPALGFIRPVVPNTIQLGFLHVHRPQPLSNEWQTYLDKSKHGVIYFSFGTNVKTSNLKGGTVGMFLEAFKQLKYDVLWKCESGDVKGIPDNVKTTLWVPQQDLLAHPKIKLFITQGGHQSIEEAIDRQVPMIIIPMIVDQFANSKRVANKGAGIALNLNEITAESFKNDILEVIEQPKYKENVVALSKLVKDQPMSSIEKATWWIEYTIRHKGTKHLRYPGLDVPLYQYYYLDVIVVYILIIAIILVTIRFMIRWFIRNLRNILGKFKREKRKRD